MLKQFLIDLLTLYFDSVKVVGLDPDKLCFGSEGSIMDFINKVWDYFAIAAIGLSLVFFLIEINRKLAMEGRDLNLRQFSVPFLKLVAAMAVLSKGGSIVGWILSLNNDIITNMYVAINQTIEELDTTAMVTAWEEQLTTGGFIICCLLFLPLLLCWLLSLVCTLVWWFKSLTYKLELVMRVCFAPFALADIYSGQSSTAVRYLKGFIALGLYAASFVVVPKIVMLLGFDVMNDAILDGNVWDLIVATAQWLILPFAALGCMGAVRSATKEALGA